jgi:type III polyketide synthase
MKPDANGTNGIGGGHATPPVPGLWITGVGSQYPAYLLGPEKLDEFAKRFYDVEKPGLKKLLQINRSSGIDTRAAIRNYESGFASRPDPPSITELDAFYRQAGVDLAAQACRKAIREWGGAPTDITHTIAVTCTNQGNPGYDLLVAQRLNLPSTVERILLHGVGCAGGLAILRTAAQIACGATARGKPARVLAYACELCTPNVRHDLAEAEACADPADVSIAGVLFSDGAAAFVLCNEYGMLDNEDKDPLFQLIEWGNSTIPDTMQHMGFYADPIGFRTVLTRDVPSFTKKVIGPLFQQLLPSFREKVGLGTLDTPDFDWALHPGGEAIIHGAQEMLDLTNEQLRATRQIYKTRGNSSSPTVLAVLDLLRTMGRGKDHIVATSFGPGLVIEMALFRRCRAYE